MDGIATGGTRMGRIRAWIRVLWIGGFTATAIAAGCGGSSPPEQSGTQRLAGRDLGNLFFWNEQTPTFTRQTATPGSPNQDLWVWPDGENAPLLALSGIDWSLPNGTPEIIVGDILMTGSRGERVYDLQTRNEVDLGPLGLGGFDWASVRRDGGSILIQEGTGGLIAGLGPPFTSLPPPYFSVAADFMGNDLAVLATPSTSDITTTLIYRLALPSGELSPLPVPAFPTIFPICLPFAMPPCKTFRVVGCGDDDTVCAETGRPPCAILYVRANATTAVDQPYVFDVNTGQETALPGSDPSEFVLSPDRHSAAWMHVDPADTSSGVQPPVQTPIYIHNFCSGAAVECPLPAPQQIEWRRDSQELVVDVASRQIAVVDVSAGTCSVLGAGTTYGGIDLHIFSPAGDRLAWTAADPTSNSSADILWVGDAAGGGARMVANDVLGFAFSPDGQSLFMGHANGGQFSLGWLSLAADSGPEQLIADAFSGTTVRGNQRVLLLDHWNTQDGSGNLDLVDLPSGTSQVLAHAVTDVAASGSVDGAARVMYAVHGRFASAQDGLWQTTLPAP